MKSTKIASAILLGVIIPFLYACPKPKSPIAPEPDTEVESSVDVSYATFLVSDIDMICGFVGDGDASPDFYLDSPESANTYTTTHPVPETYVAAFNNVKCVDGVRRDGSIFINFENTNPNARYYREFEYHGKITLSEYKVNGWLIKTVNGVPCHVYNKLTSSNYDPTKTKLSWTIEGSFEFTHPTDPSKNMLWTGKLTKTLVNTADPAVFHPSRQQSIKWEKAVVEYSGEAVGYTSGNIPFTLKINKETPLMRDFTCYPNEIGGVSSVQPLKTWKEEFHPFKKGVASLTTGDKYGRQIYYGNEGNAGLDLQCDNSGEVLIKGNSYKVDFIK